MGLAKLEYKGDFSRTTKFLNKLSQGGYIQHIAEKYAKEGVVALSKATPVDSGLTASSWYYDISITGDTLTISWNNSNIVNGYANIALLIQYGHGTGTGGYVQGRDYINPALQPIFDKMAQDVWMEVTK